MAASSGRLSGRTALIVGGGQIAGATIGNGRATALTFAREGARLVVADLDLAAAQETVQLVEAGGGEALAFQGNIVEEADCRRFAEETVKAFGRIDILQNNVGIGPGDSGPTKITADAWRHILDVNLTGMLLAAKAVLPIMQSQRHGVITNISSMLSITSDSTVRASATDQSDGEGQVAYRVSKSGVNSLTESLAMRQAAYGIRVNAILPGLIRTPTPSRPSWTQAASTAPASRARGTRRCRSAVGRGQPGTWPTHHCSSPRMRRVSSLAFCSPWTGVSA